MSSLGTPSREKAQQPSPAAPPQTPGWSLLTSLLPRTSTKTNPTEVAGETSLSNIPSLSSSQYNDSDRLAVGGGPPTTPSIRTPQRTLDAVVRNGDIHTASRQALPKIALQSPWNSQALNQRLAEEELESTGNSRRMEALVPTTRPSSWLINGDSIATTTLRATAGPETVPAAATTTVITDANGLRLPPRSGRKYHPTVTGKRRVRKNVNNLLNPTLQLTSLKPPSANEKMLNQRRLQFFDQISQHVSTKTTIANQITWKRGRQLNPASRLLSNGQSEPVLPNPAVKRRQDEKTQGDDDDDDDDDDLLQTPKKRQKREETTGVRIQLRSTLNIPASGPYMLLHTERMSSDDEDDGDGHSPLLQFPLPTAWSEDSTIVDPCIYNEFTAHNDHEPTDKKPEAKSTPFVFAATDEKTNTSLSTVLPSSSPPSTTATATTSSTTKAPILGWGGTLLASMNRVGWKCPICMVFNKEDLNQCPSCDAPNPSKEGAAAPAPSTSSTTVRTATEDSVPSTSTVSGVTFGTSKTQPPSNTGGSGGFTFGAPTTSTKATSAPSPTTNAGMKFTFGVGTAAASGPPLSQTTITKTDSKSAPNAENSNTNAPPSLFSFGSKTTNTPSLGLTFGASTGSTGDGTSTVHESSSSIGLSSGKGASGIEKKDDDEVKGPMGFSFGSTPSTVPLPAFGISVEEKKSFSPAPFTFGATKSGTSTTSDSTGSTAIVSNSGGFKFGSVAKESSQQAAPAPSLTFGESAPALERGTLAPSTAAPAIGTNTLFQSESTTATPTFQFGGNGGLPTGNAVGTSSAASSGMSSFAKNESFSAVPALGGTPAPTATFMFGQSTTKPETNAAFPSVASGDDAASNKRNRASDETPVSQGPFKFGVSPAPPSSNALNAPTVPSFGSLSSAAADSSRVSSTPAPSFPTSSLSTAGGFSVGSGATSGSAPIFGVPTTAATSSAPIFGAPTTAATSSAPIFGAPTTAATSSAPIFGAPTTAAPSSVPAFGATSSQPFGSSAPAVGGFSTTTPSFGTSAPPPQQQQQQQQGPTQPLFGQPNFSAPSPATFGAPPLFGGSTSTSGVVPQFGSTAPVPAFGSSAPATGGFGMAAPSSGGFGMAAPPPPAAFGYAASGVPSFGQTGPSVGSVGPPTGTGFGQQQQQAAPQFGGSGFAGVSDGGGFSMGSAGGASSAKRRIVRVKKR